MQHRTQPLAIDTTTLTQAVRNACAAPSAELGSWQVQLLSHREINRVPQSVYRIAGTASDAQRQYDWSLVVKVMQCSTHHPGSDCNASIALTHWKYWRREAEVYASTLFRRMPASLAVPHCYAITTPSVDEIWLWLEDIQGTPATAWPIERFGAATYALARFQVAYLNDPVLPTLPWLCRGWLRAWVPEPQAGCIELVRDPASWHHPLLSHCLPEHLQARVLRLWDVRDTLLHAVEQLPQTLCHLDLWPNNMFDRSTRAGDAETVLIDWPQAGFGTLGEDIANLTLDSVWMFCVPAARLLAFEHYVWSGYLTGLRAAGWAGDERQVRFVYTAVAALRFGTLTGRLIHMAHDTSQHAWLEQRYGRSIHDIIDVRAAAVAHALTLAREAETLA